VVVGAGIGVLVEGNRPVVVMRMVPVTVSVNPLVARMANGADSLRPTTARPPTVTVRRTVVVVPGRTLVAMVRGAPSSRLQ
jgi:hypothetical protein